MPVVNSPPPLGSDEIKLPSGLSLRNRLAKGAMTENLADPKTNSPNGMHVKLYERWGKCGAGLLITGNVMVDSRYLECPGNVVVENGNDMKLLTEWATKSQANGSAVLVQISHAGRQCPISVCSTPVAPSPLPPVKAALPLFNRSRALTIDEIKEIVDRFATTASVLHQAGFVGVQVHAAHGYLISQFLSPLTNHRTDAYGGSAENRRQLLKEIVEKIRDKEGPSFTIAVKLNSADFQRGGFSKEESFGVVQMLCDLGVDLIEVSGGTYESPELLRTVDMKKSSREREAFFFEYVNSLHQHMTSTSAASYQKVPIMLTGGFRSSSGVHYALQSNVVDIVGIARPFCTEPTKVRELFEGMTESKAITLFSPSLRIPFWSKMDAALQNLWHQRQIRRLAVGRDPDLNMGLLYCLLVQSVLFYVVSPRRLSHMQRVKVAAICASVITFVAIGFIFFAVVR